MPDASSESVKETVEGVQRLIETYGPAALKAVAVLVIGWIVAKIITAMLRKIMHKSRVETLLIGFVTNLAYMGLMTLVVISALGALGIPTASFAAVIAAAGLAIGLALQGSLSNFASGVLLMIFRPFKVGDFIEAGGTSGSVTDLQVFCTVLNTPDNKRIIVPNAAVTGGNITNYSTNDTRRVDMVFGIGYGDDMTKAKRVLEEVLGADKRILKDPAPVIAVSELADSSVNFVVRPWVKSGDYWGVYFDITEAVKARFDAQGISIPFPQHDVHVHKDSEAA